jgi:hypothetical protein
MEPRLHIIREIAYAETRLGRSIMCGRAVVFGSVVLFTVVALAAAKAGAGLPEIDQELRAHLNRGSEVLL